MIKSLNTGATGMKAQQTNMDTIAHNMANVTTTGFKKSRAEFEDLIYQTHKEPGATTGNLSRSPTGVQVGLGVKTSAITRDYMQGSTKLTKQPFDLEIQGKGFFMVQLPNGEVAYTRDGSFKRDGDGVIKDSNGHILMPGITVPQDTTQIEIAGDGTVRVVQGYNDINDIQTIGQIELATFINPAGLKSIGKNNFLPSRTSGQPQIGTPGQNQTGMLAQGQLEQSNVNIVDEMVNMITAQRAYESNSKVIQASDQMLQYVNSLR